MQARRPPITSPYGRILNSGVFQTFAALAANGAPTPFTVVSTVASSSGKMKQVFRCIVLGMGLYSVKTFTGNAMVDLGFTIDGGSFMAQSG